MKAIIEFNLPDDHAEYKIFNSAQAMHSVLWEFKQELREWLKHGHDFKTADEAVEKINARFHQLLNDDNIDLN